MAQVQVGIIMGSQSDWPTLREAAEVLDELGVSYETKIVSAHRTPDRLWDYGKTAVERGLQVIIAGAGGAAHLPGMMASKTRVPVIGVPVKTDALSGVDSLYSYCKCPADIPWQRWPSALQGLKMPACLQREYWHCKTVHSPSGWTHGAAP